MPECSSATTTSLAFLHMNSIASWSPSQSEPLTVSYMCHVQWSSSELPREAATPPWAATVCERVGKTLDSTAVFRPASDNWIAERRPAPPAPTMTASNFRTGILTLTASRESQQPTRCNPPTQQWSERAGQDGYPSASRNPSRYHAHQSRRDRTG